MKTRAIIIGAILFTLLLSSAYSLPNLKMEGIEYSPVSGRIVAQVVNDSKEDIEEFKIAFFVDGEQLFFSSEAGYSLGQNSTISLYAEYPDDGKEHDFFASADPLNEIEESNEEDNIAEAKTETWGNLNPPAGAGSGGAAYNVWSDPLVLSLSIILVILTVAFAVVITLAIIKIRGKKNE